MQETGAELVSCQNGGPAPAGYCYVDDPASPLLKNCPVNQQQLLRFVDEGDVKTPVQGAVAFIACIGAPVGTDADAGQ